MTLHEIRAQIQRINDTPGNPVALMLHGTVMILSIMDSETGRITDTEFSCEYALTDRLNELEGTHVVEIDYSDVERRLAEMFINGRQ